MVRLQMRAACMRLCWMPNEPYFIWLSPLICIISDAQVSGNIFASEKYFTIMSSS